MNTRKILPGFVLMIALATAVTTALPLQDDPKEAARLQAQQEAAARAREQQALREEKSRQDWLNNERTKSESNLAAREKEVAPFRGRENETRFSALQTSTQELVDLSVKINNQVNASGAQSISVSFYSDLDKVEKLVKAIRKSAK